MRRCFFPLFVLLATVLLHGSPPGASAQFWDYLFEDLSWTMEGTIGEGAGSFGERGNGGETQQSGYFDYLFEDLSWPAGALSLDGFTGTGIDAGTPESGFFDYLFADLSWPDGTFSELSISDREE